MTSDFPGRRIVGYAFAACSALWLAFFFNYGQLGELTWSMVDAGAAYYLLRVRS